jgi:hypothetical protein
MSVWVILLLSVGISAQETPENGIQVKDLQFCTGVEDRQSVGTDTTFANTVETVFCYTRITGAADTTLIAHVWYHNDEQKADVELTVKSNDWRTWSSKRIAPEWTGPWRVEVKGPNGEVLASESFAIIPAEE